MKTALSIIFVLFTFYGIVKFGIDIYKGHYRGNVKCIECRYFNKIIMNDIMHTMNSCDHPDCYRTKEIYDPINGKHKETRRIQLEGIYKNWNRYNNCKRSSRREDDYHGAR